MKTKCFLLTFMLFGPAVALWAGESIPLDRDFAFRLAQPAPESSPAPAVPLLPSRPDAKPPAPRTTPEGAPLPPGARAFRFNGQTFYFIPLRG